MEQRAPASQLTLELCSVGVGERIVVRPGENVPVDGIIRVFSALAVDGINDPAVLSHGISEALICTASGLIVAIPSLFFHRYFEALVYDHVLQMEENALRLIDLMQGHRELI